MDKFIVATNKPSHFLEQLQTRGLVQDHTPGLGDYLKNAETLNLTPKVYAGFDPSAASLHVGNLLPALMLRRAQLCGIQPIVLLGGATGLIGDPSGKKEERTLLEKDQAADNIEKIKAQLMKFVDFSPGKTQGIVANNFDWFKSFSFLDFLRDVGKHITVNYMTAKDSVKIRMETGISYAEFGYMLVQGYDFLHLFEAQNCAIQLGGSDQWGNMTTGLELIRRKHGKEAHAVSAPLLTDSAGNKLGKSEKGAIYLDPSLTSPFRFYQYWLGIHDTDAPKVLRYLTFFRDDYVANLEEKIKSEPESRTAQRVLAHELTRLVHGEEAALGAENASKVLFSKDASVLKNLNAKALEVLATEVPSIRWPEAEKSLSLLALLTRCELATSNGEAKRHIKSGAVSLNREKVSDENLQVNASDLFAERPFCLVGVGKNKLVLVLKA